MLRKLCLLFLALGVSSAALAADPGYYQVQLTVERDGEVVSKPTVVLEGTSEGTLSIANESGGEDLRILVSVPSELSTKEGDAVNLRLVLNQFNGKAWTALSDARVGVLLGKSASTQIDGSDHVYKIHFTVVKKSADEVSQNAACGALTDLAGGIAKLSDSDYELCEGSLVGSFASLTNVSEKTEGCCSVRCGVNTLTCCNVIQCCEGLCNKCCSPK